MRRAGFWGLVVLVLAAVGVAGYVAVDRLGGEPETADDETDVRHTFVTVTRTDIVETESLDGVMRFRDPRTVFSAAPGTITGLPEAGTVLGRGDTAYELDGVPVVTFFGDRPMWRTVGLAGDEETEGVTPEGADVNQVEANLARLGFDADGEMTVDSTFTEATAAAIAAWQEETGRPVTGQVTPADVLFVPAPARVGAHATAVGTVVAPGTPLFATSGRDHEVVVLVDADRQDLLAPGDEVTVELANGTSTPAAVASVGRVVTTVGEGPEARRVVEVIVELPDESFAGDLDETPVDVVVETSRAAGVLAVPVEALLALAEGGYALEVEEGAGVRLVGVETGVFGDGVVAVSGDIAEGDRVAVPG